jgi:hypothetical protein
VEGDATVRGDVGDADDKSDVPESTIDDGRACKGAPTRRTVRVLASNGASGRDRAESVEIVRLLASDGASGRAVCGTAAATVGGSPDSRR